MLTCIPRYKQLHMRTTIARLEKLHQALSENGAPRESISIVQSHDTRRPGRHEGAGEPHLRQDRRGRRGALGRDSTGADLHAEAHQEHHEDPYVLQSPTVIYLSCLSPVWGHGHHWWKAFGNSAVVKRGLHS